MRGKELWKQKKWERHKSMSPLALEMTAAFSGPGEGRHKTMLLINQGMVAMTVSCGLIISLWLYV